MTHLRFRALVFMMAAAGCGPVAGRDGADLSPVPNGGLGTKADDPNHVEKADLAGVVGTAYNDVTVDGGCPQGAASCAGPIDPSAGCGPVEICGADGTGNGIDDNCDGIVDETCVCRPGDVESCFLGPPGKHHVGACTDGTQTCEGAGEFGSWGKCHGSIGPHAETCDRLDNDCNGCADDSLCCAAVLDCPGPGDPRIAPSQPYTDVPLLGGQFYSGQAQAWNWTIDGGPCDQLFKTTTGNTPQQSFSLINSHKENAMAHYTLSGDYTVTMTVLDTQGQTQTCTWVQHISGPGLRFELCWDKTGDVDLDLHVHEPGDTSNWFQDPSLKTSFDPSPHDCNYSNCKAENYGSTMSVPEPMPSWNYTGSQLSQCIGSPSGQEWASNLNACANPRLDIDNIFSVGVPENINIDKPKQGETFRAMVHDYSQNGAPGDQHPLVNIYCGGKIVATYGQTPNQVAGFDQGGGWARGSMWRVADVTTQVDTNGNTTGCMVNALHPPATPTSGYWLTTDDTSY